MLLISIDEIQSVNEWGKPRQRSYGPASNYWFCLREEESQTNGRVAGKPGKIVLDKNLFWSVAFFFNEIGTCGVEWWDDELKVSRVVIACKRRLSYLSLFAGMRYRFKTAVLPYV